MHNSAVSQDNLISATDLQTATNSDSQSQGLSDSTENNFSHGEDLISDGVNLFGQGPSLVRSAPAVYG